MKKSIISIIQSIIALVTVFALTTFLKPCDSDMKMNCEKSVHIVMILFAIIAVAHIIAAIFKTRGIAVNVLTILISIAIILVPAKIYGGCKMADMACRSVSFPGIYIISSIFIVVNIILIIIGFIKRKDIDQ